MTNKPLTKSNDENIEYKERVFMVPNRVLLWFGYLSLQFLRIGSVWVLLQFQKKIYDSVPLGSITKPNRTEPNRTEP